MNLGVTLILESSVKGFLTSPIITKKEKIDILAAVHPHVTALAHYI